VLVAMAGGKGVFSGLVACWLLSVEGPESGCSVWRQAIPQIMMIIRKMGVKVLAIILGIIPPTRLTVETG
jgi:hypothetical protein